MDDTTLTLGVMIGVTILIAIFYFIPTIVAAGRGQHNTFAVFLVNFLVGYSGIGWLIALLMAFADEPSKEVENKA